MIVALLGLIFGLLGGAQQRDLTIEPASRRKALLIVNNRHLKQALANAVNHASDFSASLRKTGFETELRLDADLRTMDLAIQKFVQNLTGGDVALFYFSGHGMSVEGENFLIPVLFAAESEADVRYQAYSASRVRDLLRGRGVRLTIIVLDACRSNPFRASRAAGGGLAGMSGAGAFIAFAADEGRTADDNPKDRNGLFTKHLLREIQSPGVGLESLFTRVRWKVYEESKGRQTPFSYSGLLGKLQFLTERIVAAPYACCSTGCSACRNSATGRVTDFWGEAGEFQRRSDLRLYSAGTLDHWLLSGEYLPGERFAWQGSADLDRILDWRNRSYAGVLSEGNRECACIAFFRASETGCGDAGQSTRSRCEPCAGKTILLNDRAAFAHRSRMGICRQGWCVSTTIEAGGSLCLASSGLDAIGE